MAVTVREPRDERFGELGSGLGTLLGGFLRNRQQQRAQQQQQEAFIGMAGAATKEEFIQQAAPLATTPQMALQIQTRADDKFSGKLQEYEVNLRAADGTIREKVKWLAAPNMTTLDLKDSVNKVMQPQGMEFMFGTPRTAPAQVEPVTGRVVSPGPVSAGEFASIEAGKGSRTARATGARPTKQDVDAKDYLVQQDFQVTPRNMTRARSVQKNLPALREDLTKVFTQAFGPDWASFGGNEEKFTRALQMGESMIFMGSKLSDAIAISTVAAKQEVGAKTEAAEQEQADKALEKVGEQTRDIGEDVGAARSFFGNLLGARQEEGKEPLTEFRGVSIKPPEDAEPAEAAEPKLVPLGTKDGEIIFIPDGVRTATEAVNYLVQQGWKWEDAREFVLAQEAD